MKIIEPLNIKGYEFNDLNDDAKERAVCGHIAYWIDTKVYNHKNKGNFEKAVDKSVVPFLLATNVYRYCKEEIIKEILESNILYEQDGYVLPIKCCNYTNYTEQKNKMKIKYIISDNVEIDVNLVDCN